MHRFPVVITRLEGPGIVHGRGSFPQPLQSSLWYLIVSQAAVVADVVTYPSADDALRLQAPYQSTQSETVGSIDGIRGVEPYQSDGTILGKELAHLRFTFFLQIVREMLLLRVVVLVVAEAVGMVPILVL